jgi:uncharacterized membrane protein
VTLNLTLLTRDAIHQSADYRLVDVRTKRVVDTPSTKKVSLQYVRWTGSVTYAGIGRVGGGEDTADIVARWVVGLADPTFEQVVEVIRNRGSQWLRALRLRVEDRRHTFVVTAFVNGVATAAVVSNHIRWQGREMGLVADDLTVTTVRSTGRPRLIVTGVTGAVDRSERELLVHLAKLDPWNGVRLRGALGRVNRLASGRQPQYISADCFTFTQDRSGRGSEGPLGDTPARPALVFGGEEMMGAVRSLLDQQFGPGNWGMRGSTSVVVGPHVPAALPPRCLGQVVRVPGAFDVRELARPAGERATARAVNRNGVTVGSGTPVWNGPSYPCIWRSPEALEWLPHLGGLGGNALAINDSGYAVGHSELPDRSSRATVWAPDLSLGVLSERSSGARGIGPGGEVIGWVGIHPSEQGQQHQRPAYWGIGRTVVYMDTGGTWGQGVALNDSGQLVGFLHDGRDATGCRLKVDGTLEELATGCRSYWPAGIAGDGSIFGTCIDAHYGRQAMSVAADGTATVLALPPRSELTAVGRDGSLAGRQTRDGVKLPWVWFRGDQEPVLLPYFRDHHHMVYGISERTLLVGAATGDHCSHALLWQHV